MISKNRQHELDNLFLSFPAGQERGPYYAFLNQRLEEDPVAGGEDGVYLIELGYQKKNVFFTCLYASLLDPNEEDDIYRPYFKEGKNKEKCIGLLKWAAEENGPLWALEDLLDLYWNDSADYLSYLKTAGKWLKLYQERADPKEATTHILLEAEDAKKLRLF